MPRDDLTKNVGQIYKALRQVFTDLNALAYDFHRLLAEEGRELKGPEQYSYGPRRIALCGDNAWLYVDPDLQGPPVDAPAHFAAVYALFHPNEEQQKVGAEDRPEVWFFLGRVQAPRLSPLDVWTYLKRDERKRFDAPLALGTIARYSYQDATQLWDTLCLGLELGDLESPESLREKVIIPLLAQESGAESIEAAPALPVPDLVPAPTDRVD